ncbi:TPA: hypothetical protein EYP66_25665 [Candidatus Poribacteria bacterium]|nr:hypothetical protein [Candidatus Poribacteria bacterium]
MKLFMTIALICLMIIVGAAWSDIIHVPTPEYPTIQAGIDVAQDGDIVLVADGTYSVPDDPGYLDFGGRAITVESENGPAVTTIDCSGSVNPPVLRRAFYFHSGEERDSILDGFTIINGVKYLGGAIACDASSPTIKNNIIIGNKAILKPTDLAAGQIVPAAVPGGKGGAIICNFSSPMIINNIIIGNESENVGGAIVCNGASPDIINNIIAGNSATDKGGAIACLNASSPNIIYNTITGNSAEDLGGGIISFQGSSPNILNTILWENAASQGNEITVETAEITISYSDVMGGEEGIFGDPDFIYWEEGNITKEPLLDGNYHLTDYSPCIGAGTDTSDITEDIDGDARPSIPDMGADENARDTPLPRGDVSGNESVTAFDASLVLQHVVGLINLSEGQQKGADVTGDKLVSAFDAALILQHTVGLITIFPAEIGVGAPILDAKSESELLADAIKKVEKFSLDREQKEVIQLIKSWFASSIIPTHTTLFQNYPNPFNPETWLPYQLAQDALVTIHIYNTKGQFIRSLHLGEKQAGKYVTKERAAYWDGRDNFGQKVASGVYFYTMQMVHSNEDATEKYTETRRMVVLK